MSETSIDDPFGAVKAATGIAFEIEQLGCTIGVSADINDLTAVRIKARNGPASPFFDPLVSGLTPDRFFWMKLTGNDGSIAALQAYRCDYVDTSLTDWAPTYHIGLYMRRNEMCLPTHAAPPKNSIADRIRGRLVYHGEFWVNAKVRNRKLMEKFSRLGMVLSLLKWHPSAIWALSTKDMATHGHPGRMGYNYLESGFLRWQWASDEKYLNEWLHVAERRSIEMMINEMNSGRGESATVVDHNLKLG